MKKQFIIDGQGKKLAVILSITEYHKILEDLEELEDIKLYDSAKKSKLEFMEAREAFKGMDKERKDKQK